MSQTDAAPIEVTESALPGQLAALVRDGLVGAAAWAVGKGYIDQATGTQLIIVGVGLATVAWRQWVTWRTHQKLVVTANAAPSRVAVVR